MKRDWYQRGRALLEDIRSTRPGPDEVALWYVGQCGFVFKSIQATVYIDPVLNDLVDKDGNTRRMYPAPFAPMEVEADYLICTHGHRDHLALETVSGAARGCPGLTFLAPGGCVRQLEEAGVPKERIVPLKAGEPLSLPGLSVYPVQAAHPVHTIDQNGQDVALGYSLQLGNVNLLHLGDTYLTDQLLQDLKSLPRPDLFFPPINGGDYFRTARNCIGNLNPLEAARLAVLLNAGLTIPTHFDMIAGNLADPLVFVRQLFQESTAAPWKLPALGERILFRK